MNTTDVSSGAGVGGGSCGRGGYASGSVNSSQLPAWVTILYSCFALTWRGQGICCEAERRRSTHASAVRWAATYTHGAPRALISTCFFFWNEFDLIYLNSSVFKIRKGARRSLYLPFNENKCPKVTVMCFLNKIGHQRGRAQAATIISSVERGWQFLYKICKERKKDCGVGASWSLPQATTADVRSCHAVT